MKFFFAGGGTGGHLFSGVALAELFLSDFQKTKSEHSKNEVLFVGTAQGLEATVLPKLGFRLALLPVRPLKGKNLLSRIRALLQLPKAFLQARRLLKKEKPDLVFGIGGYASGPVTLMAKWMKIPTAIIEQNSYPGFTNRFLGKRVDRVFIAFEKAKRFFPLSKTILTGNPIRNNFYKLNNVLDINKSKFTLFILGGSQGAHAINEAFCIACESLKPFIDRFEILHQTGKTDFESVKKFYSSRGIDAKVFDFKNDIQDFYQSADLVIARAGAGTIAELEQMGKPAILIPYPYAADDHQRFNALELSEVGAAKLILQTELSGGRLAEEILTFMNDRSLLEKMAAASKKRTKPHPAKEILRICMELLEKQNG